LVSDALDLLKFSKIVSAKDVSKLIRSAVANASQKPGVNLNRLYVRTIFVNEGPTLKRIITRARGSADRMEKKMSHIHVTLGEKI